MGRETFLHALQKGFRACPVHVIKENWESPCQHGTSDYSKRFWSTGSESREEGKGKDKLCYCFPVRGEEKKKAKKSRSDEEGSY